MAEEVETQGHYSPLPGHDIWAFGLLLLEMLGISLRQPHYDAMKAFDQGDMSSTRNFARSLMSQPSYYGMVSAFFVQACLHCDKAACGLLGMPSID